MKASLPIRGSDSHGSGAYLASRGSKKHNGIDFACYEGTKIYPHKYGEVTKLGYPYNNSQLRYVQVTDEHGYNLRYFYVKPCVKVGDKVTTDDCVGESQTLQKRYPGITDHIHFEVKFDKSYADPIQFIETL